MLQPGHWYLDRANASVVFRPTAADLARGPEQSMGSVLSAVGVDSASTALLELNGVTALTFDGVRFDQGGGWSGATTPLGYTETQGVCVRACNFTRNQEIYDRTFLPQEIYDRTEMVCL
jgi:hypothetical protein